MYPYRVTIDVIILADNVDEARAVGYDIVDISEEKWEQIESVSVEEVE